MELYPVSVDILYDGMMVDFGIYYYQNNKPVLLCKDVILTTHMINSLKMAMSYCSNVYMDKENHDRLLRETAYFKKAQIKLEQTVGYDVMKVSARSMLNDAAQYGFVHGEAVDSLVSSINEKISDIDGALIMQCINGVRDMDKYLYVHSLNVGFLNGLMGQWCGYDKTTINKMIKVGLVHDLGKLKISPEILNKPARLTTLEYEAIKRHPEFGCQILKLSGETDQEILDAVMHHHERINGLGYPHRIRDKQISPISRITAISDVYDAMTAKRPYKEAYSPFIILRELKDNAFSDLDMKYVKVLIENMPNELRGRSVLLSNGAVGKVEYIDKRHLEYPIISIDGKIEKTTKDLYCIRMYAGL